jgi:Protein of unknown function (DUF2939)
MSSKTRFRFLYWLLPITFGVGIIGYVATGPYRTMRELGEALAARDTASVAECVDFPKIRESIKQQVTKGVSERSKTVFADNPIASLAASLATNLSDTLVDSLVTPKGLEQLLAGENALSQFAGSSENRSIVASTAIDSARYSFRSLSEFTVTLEPKPNVLVTLVLAREGLSWKIVEIRLPD